MSMTEQTAREIVAAVGSRTLHTIADAIEQSAQGRKRGYDTTITYRELVALLRHVADEFES